MTDEWRKPIDLEDLHYLLSCTLYGAINRALVKPDNDADPGTDDANYYEDLRPLISNPDGDEDAAKLAAFHDSFGAMLRAINDCDCAFHDLWDCR